MSLKGITGNDDDDDDDDDDDVQRNIILNSVRQHNCFYYTR